MLPKAKLIVLLQDPVKRAYSWYQVRYLLNSVMCLGEVEYQSIVCVISAYVQHMRAHNDAVAIKYSFLEVLTATSNHTPIVSDKTKLQQLRQHCLEPGRYHKYITKWLKFFPPYQMLFVDGGMVDMQPTRVLAAVQKFLKVPAVDYGEMLRYASVS